MLACTACGQAHDAATAWRCTCGAPLDLADPPRPDASAPPARLDREAGLAAFEAFLPASLVQLGEGWTPLVDAPAWEATFKLEHISPTGSFKDRGAASVVGLARDLGVDRVIEDSSGNAGLAIATYAAAAGVPATIYVPADAAPGKLQAIEAAGADLVRVEGTRGDVTDACVDAVGDGDGWYASHAWNPAFHAGTATFALEYAAQRGWAVPDAVVTPLGHGTLLLGAYQGFQALAEAGWTDAVPRLVGVQAAGAAPVADAYGHPGPKGERNALADGVQIQDPVRGDGIREAIDATDGTAIALGEEATRAAYERLRRTGFHVEPTSALGPAALEPLREAGHLGPDEDVVVPLTGTGLKG